MKTYVITVSRNFLKTHPKAGEPTFFKEKIISGTKLHTIRNNYKYWSNIINKVNSGEAILSVRYWEGKPYASKQVEIIKYAKVGMQNITMLVDGEIFINDRCIKINEIEKLAKNDGLNMQDFYDWFELDKLKPNTEFNGIIIHFTDLKY